MSLNYHAFLLNSFAQSCDSCFKSRKMRSHVASIPSQQWDSLQMLWLKSLMCCFCLIFPPWGALHGGFLWCLIFGYASWRLRHWKKGVLWEVIFLALFVLGLHMYSTSLMESFGDKNNTLTLFGGWLLQHNNCPCCSELVLILPVFHLPDFLTWWNI